MAHGILGVARLGSLGSHGSLVLGCIAVLVIESVDLDALDVVGSRGASS